MNRAAGPAMLFAALAAACATPALRAGESLAVRGHPVPPFEIHQACAIVAAGEALTWRFEAEVPVRFLVFYRDGPVEVSPLVKDAVQEDAGRYVALAAAQYCLEWGTGATGTLLDYRIGVLPAAR